MKETQDKIKKISNSLRDFLLEKNKRYGDSALNPINVFSKLSAEDAISVRLDDKLKRIQNNTDDMRKNDVVDIMGYLLLLCVEKNWTSFDEFLD